MATISDLQDVDMTTWLDWMGIDYRRATGSHRTQLNLRECPVCGNAKWKVYLNEETGLGNCFHGDCETKFNKYKFIKATIHGGFKDVMENIDEFLDATGWRPKTEPTPKVSQSNQHQSRFQSSQLHSPADRWSEFEISHAARRYQRSHSTLPFGLLQDGSIPIRQIVWRTRLQRFLDARHHPHLRHRWKACFFSRARHHRYSRQKYLFPPGLSQRVLFLQRP